MNTHELLQADRKIWNEVSSLHAEGWTLDEALHEMTCIKADVHALLQPRARPPTQRDGKGKGKPGKGNGKKGGGKAQTRLKDDVKVTAVAEAMRNLQLKHGNKTLCIRFNKTECNDRNCKFAHLCAIRLSNEGSFCASGVFLCGSGVFCGLSKKIKRSILALVFLRWLTQAACF